MTPKEEIKRKSFFGFQSFWIQFFLILKSVLYRGFFKGIIERLCAIKPALYRNLRYRLTLYWGKINWKIKGFIWWSEKNYVISKSTSYRVTLYRGITVTQCVIDKTNRKIWKQRSHFLLFFIWFQTNNLDLYFKWLIQWSCYKRSPYNCSFSIKKTGLV